MSKVTPQQSPMEILKGSLEKEQTKVNKIDEIIEKLQTQQIEVKKKTNKETSFYKILGKYITFLEYIKSIIKVKIDKDNKIIALQENFFKSINVITSRIQNINLSLPQKEANISKTSKIPEQTNDNPGTTIEKLDNQLNDLTNKLNEFNKKADKKKVYLLDFNTGSNGLDLGNRDIIEQRQQEINNIQQNCTKDIKSTVNAFINTLNSAQSGGTNAKLNSPSFQGNDQGYYDIINNNIFKTPNDNYELKNNNIKTNQLIHTEKLKEIKEAYEEELKINVENYKKICDALITLLKKINETNDKLKNFNESKKNINKKNELNKKIQEENRRIQEENKRIEEANKIIQDKKERKLQINKLLSQISTLQNLIAQNKIIYKILDLQDIKNGEIFKANHEALVGEDGKSGLLGEITNAKSKLLNINIPQNTTQITGNPGSSQAQSTGQQGQVRGQITGNPGSSQAQSTGQKGNNANSIISSANSLKTVISAISDSNDIPNNTNKNMKILQELSNTLASLYPTNTNPIKLQQDFNSIPPTPNDSIPKGDITVEDKNINRYNNIVDRINNQKNRIDQLAIYIYVMKNYTDAVDIKKKLYLEVRKKNLFAENKTIQLDKISQLSAGKSKNSKSKKSKKAKSTKKQKTPGTQVKSYNNPKYKNQDGGFVRGGVLFPESFYRSDIVM